MKNIILFIDILIRKIYVLLLISGINPVSVRGSRTGVFIGVSASESDDYFTGDPDRVNGYGLTGCCRAMFPNRISYTFDFTGKNTQPYLTIETKCNFIFSKSELLFIIFIL